MTSSLMMGRSAAPERPLPTTPTQDGGSSHVLQEGVRLLFADDDPILREFASVHLGTERGRVVTAADGEDAWKVLQTQGFDLLLIDLEMPRLDGFGLVRRLRQDPRFRDLPVIVVTGREDVNAIDRAFDAGATSFLVKPINWRLLAYQVRFVLRTQRAMASLQAEPAAAAAAPAPAGPDMAAWLRALLTESSPLLNLAMAGDAPLQEAAARFVGLLDRLSREAEAAQAGRAA
jgi:DNA-binding response OmpR family regulator